MGRAHTWMLAAALAQAMRANAARPNAAPSDRKPEEKRMNDQAPPADAPAPTAPAAQPAPDAPAPGVPAPDTASQAGAAAQPAPMHPAAGAAAAGRGDAHDVPAITDYLPVMLAATSGLLKAASAIQKQVDENQEVPAFYLDMAGNFLGMLGIMAEAYRRNTRRGTEGGHAGAAARTHPGAGADPADAV